MIEKKSKARDITSAGPKIFPSLVASLKAMDEMQTMDADKREREDRHVKEPRREQHDQSFQKSKDKFDHSLEKISLRSDVVHDYLEGKSQVKHKSR